MAARRLLAGAALLLAGLAVLGYLGWEYLGTNYVSERRHRAIVHDLVETWGSGHAQVPAAGSTARAIVRIPRFGDDYAVPLLEGTSDDVLASGIGHLEGTADPGARGNFVIAAHRVTHGEPFADLPELDPGDEVVVETAAATYTYVLDTGGDDLTVPFTDEWVIEPRPVNPDGGVQPPADAGTRLITLTTCSELFHTDNRLVVFGHLERVSRRSR
jgi:sortase A